MQNAFISTDEVESLTNYVYSQPSYSKPYYLPSIYEKKKSSSSGFYADLDPMFEEAARVIVRHQQGSVSLLQRKLKLGYSRAARIVDQLEDAGIVGPNDGSKARQVLVENDEQLETVFTNTLTEEIKMIIELSFILYYFFNIIFSHYRSHKKMHR